MRGAKLLVRGPEPFGQNAVLCHAVQDAVRPHHGGIHRPGEYEEKGIFVEGIPDGGETIYTVKAEEINLCYMGKTAHALKEDEIKEIGDIDILFVPLGETAEDVKKATALISKIDPKIVIPTFYNDLTLHEFKKAEGIVDGELDILKIKKSELPMDERKNIVLTN